MTEDRGQKTEDRTQNISLPAEKSHQQAMNAAARILAHRDHSKYELMQKLQQRGFAAKIVDTVIARCEDFGYIDDRRTARVYVLQLKRKCFGRRYIRLALKKKRLIDSAIEEILVENYPEEDEYEHAGRLLEKKMKTFASQADPQRRNDRIYRFLYSRGFSPSVIRKLVK
jgi:regulatory protein